MKITLTKQVALVLLGVAILLVIWTGVIDTLSKKYTDQAFERALITFATARALNGMISVAQGTEIAIHPAGFGINVSPGEILDPINDLIERFSWIMLASTTSLGIQKVFLNIASTFVASMFLTLIVMAAIYIKWYPHAVNHNVMVGIHSALVIMLFIRFSIPLAAIGSEFCYDIFLDDQYQQSTEKLTQTRDSIRQLNQNQQEKYDDKIDASMIEKAKMMFSAALSKVDITEKMQEYKNAATEISKQAINLIVVFLIQTIIFPFIFIWIIYQILRITANKTKFV